MSIIISNNGSKAVKVDKAPFDKEDYLQNYIYENPESIPLYDIKQDIRLLILAREFSTNSGPIDAIGIDGSGEIYIIETKLYKNADKRNVIAQALDYGASLWNHSSDFNDFLEILNGHTQKVFGLNTVDKIKDFFRYSDEEVNTVIEQAKRNLNDGVFHFVVLMDKLEDRLKDLILFVNQNSQFDIYAVEFEYYKYEKQEIIIPRIFGTEVKKDIKTNKDSGKLWNWELFKKRLQEFGSKEVVVAEKIIKWAQNNNIGIDWTKSQRGSFILGFETQDKKGFYPFAITGDAMISWNAPHQGNYSPVPFDKIEKRLEILEQLKQIKGSIVDSNNIDGYSGLKLSLSTLSDEESIDKFFSICLWIKKSLENEI